MRIDPATARCFRLSFGDGMATFLAYAAALPLGYVLIVVTLSLFAAPIPAPGAKAAVVLVVVIVVTSLDYGDVVLPHLCGCSPRSSLPMA